MTQLVVVISDTSIIQRPLKFLWMSSFVSQAVTDGGLENSTSKLTVTLLSRAAVCSGVQGLLGQLLVSPTLEKETVPVATVMPARKEALCVLRLNSLRELTSEVDGTGMIHLVARIFLRHTDLNHRAENADKTKPKHKAVHDLRRKLARQKNDTRFK